MSESFRAEGVNFSYELGSQKIPALKNVSVEIEKGKFVALAGPSGSGKTTLLNLFGLIENVRDGEIYLGQKPIKGLSEKERNAIRRNKIGLIFQNFHLSPVLSAEENVEYFLSRQGIRKSERKKKTEEALKAVGLWEHRNKKPLEMSGGQRQRVAIARAIAKDPEVIIADEPTASLDQATGRQIMEILLKLNRERGVSVIVSSHDPMVLSLAPQTIKLQDGRVVTTAQGGTA